MYGKLINGELSIAPQEFTLEDGTIISNFNRNIKAMKSQGYKAIVDSKPIYDVETQYCELVGYQETHSRIRFVWEIKEIEIPRDELLEQDTAKALEMLGVNFDSLTDEQALQVPNVFPLWKVGVQYLVGERILFDGKLYKVLTQHKSQEDWQPDISPSLFAKVLVGNDQPLEWQQPDSTNAYMKGDKVLFNGKVYASLIDNNVWSPTDYPAGWEELA